MCQQDVIIRIASRKYIQAVRLRWGIITGILVLITIALLYSSSRLPVGNLSQFLLAASILPAFGSFLSVVHIFREGTSIKHQPPGTKHQLFKSAPGEKSSPPRKNSPAQRGRQ